MKPLPVDSVIQQILEVLDERQSLVITAPPGSGKTTRVPPALIERGPLILLQPRRVAARSLARRIAAERNWTIGVEIGWQIRNERRFSSRTRLLVATEGVLTARMQSDPLISDFATVVLDEFHERTIHADLALAFVRQAMCARDDLRVVVMSATLDSSRVANFLDDCSVIDVPGRTHPIDVQYEPRMDIPDAVAQIADRTEGDILCFLPGVREIRDAASRLRASSELEVHELHGRLEVEQQEAALVPSSRRKVIVSTNVAETSLTIEGVTAVVDSGVQRVLRYDRSIGIDRRDREDLAGLCCAESGPRGSNRSRHSREALGPT